MNLPDLLQVLRSFKDELLRAKEEHGCQLHDAVPFWAP